MSDLPPTELASTEPPPTERARTKDDPFGEGPEAAKARRRRSIALAIGLVAFMVLVFVVTVVRLGGNVADRAL